MPGGKWRGKCNKNSENHLSVLVEVKLTIFLKFNHANKNSLMEHRRKTERTTVVDFDFLNIFIADDGHCLFFLLEEGSVKR